MVNRWVPKARLRVSAWKGERHWEIWFWVTPIFLRWPPPEREIAMRLTTSSVAALALNDGEKDRIVFDDDVPGFGLRLRDTGSRVWVYQYKIQRKTRRIVLGKASAVKLARAREIASEYHARVRQGGDPVSEKRVQIERASHTFGPLAEQYLERRKSSLRPRSWTATALYLRKHAQPLHSLPVDSSTSEPLRGFWLALRRVPAL